jgi:hypothetical protein
MRYHRDFKAEYHRRIARAFHMNRPTMIWLPKPAA